MLKNKNQNQLGRLMSKSTLSIDSNTIVKTRSHVAKEAMIDFLKSLYGDKDPVSLPAFQAMLECTSDFQAKFLSESLLLNFYGRGSDSLNAIQGKFKEYLDSIKSISKLFEQAMLGEYSSYTNFFTKIKQGYIMNGSTSEGANKSVTELTLSTLLANLVKYIKRSVRSLIEYSVTLGFFGNISIVNSEGLDKIVADCVHDILEPLIPLIIANYLLEIKLMYVGELDLSLITYCREVRQYTMKRYRKLLSVIASIKKSIKDGQEPIWDKFFNEMLFQGWQDTVRDRGNLRMVYRCFCDDIAPNMINYDFKFFNNIIMNVVHSKIKKAASGGSLILKFSSEKSKK